MCIDDKNPYIIKSLNGRWHFILFGLSVCDDDVSLILMVTVSGGVASVFRIFDVDDVELYSACAYVCEC